ncbi:hypothetical protein B0H10DRAFT_1968465 [Mycena sp. CBHHK59/15]|nr:hypothetical protein B0H10DRAFT_1968465 [Mycena sp. CBHHK59/15]
MSTVAHQAKMPHTGADFFDSVVVGREKLAESESDCVAGPKEFQVDSHTLNRTQNRSILSGTYGKPEHHALKQMMVMIAVNGRPHAEAVIKFCQEPGGMLNHNPDKSRTGNFDLLPRKYPGLAWREL